MKNYKTSLHYKRNHNNNFIFKIFSRSIRAFQQLLYVNPDFTRANEVHLRLGFMFKANGAFTASLKHLRLALFDSSLCTFTPLESKFYILFILYLFVVLMMKARVELQWCWLRSTPHAHSSFSYQNNIYYVCKFMRNFTLFDIFSLHMMNKTDDYMNVLTLLCF